MESEPFLDSYYLSKGKAESHVLAKGTDVSPL